MNDQPTTTTTAPRLSKAAREENERRDFIKTLHPAIYNEARQMEQTASGRHFTHQWRDTAPDQLRREFIARVWRAAYLCAVGAVNEFAGNVTTVYSGTDPDTLYTVSLSNGVFCTCEDTPPSVTDPRTGQRHSGKFCKHSLAAIIAKRAGSTPPAFYKPEEAPTTEAPEAPPLSPEELRELQEALDPRRRAARIAREKAATAEPLTDEQKARGAEMLEISREARRAAYADKRVTVYGR